MKVNSKDLKKDQVETQAEWLTIFRDPSVLVFFLLFLGAVGLFVVAVVFQHHMSIGAFQLLMGLGVAIGPASVLSLLFRFFLLGNVKRELLTPLAGLEDRTAEIIETKVEDSFKPMVEKVELLALLERLGVAYVYENRKDALQPDSSFYKNLEDEQEHIDIIGSSLRGLLQESEYGSVKELLAQKINIINFTLTHPCVADLRAFQENRFPGDIPAEILKSLLILKDFGVEPSNVRLYRGTPTCFGIRTSTRMLINPYPYTRQSMDSPCFELLSKHPVYDAFHVAHFASFNTSFAVRFEHFDDIIERLRRNVDHYSNKVRCILEEITPEQCKLR